MSIAQWQRQKLEEAHDRIEQIYKRGRGIEDTECGCDPVACRELESYLQTWMKPLIKDVLEGRR